MYILFFFFAWLVVCLLFFLNAFLTSLFNFSIRYNEFVQSCLSNYENFFSKNEYSPLPLGSGKRMRLAESARDEREMRAVTGVAQSGKEKNAGDTEMKVDSLENEESKDERRKESIDARRTRKSDDTMDVDEISDNGANKITVIETSENNDKAMGELTLSSLRDIKRICDTIDDNTCRKNDTVINVRNKLDTNYRTKNNANKADVSLSEQPGCSYSYDEETPNSGVRKSETTADSSGLESVDRKADSGENDGIKIYEETNEEKGEINDDKMEEEAINLDDVNIAKENELIVENSWRDSTSKPADVENKAIDLTNEPVEPQPCLISDLINEIDQNNKSLLRKVPSTSSLPPLTTLQTGIDQGELVFFIFGTSGCRVGSLLGFAPGVRV